MPGICSSSRAVPGAAFLVAALASMVAPGLWNAACAVPAHPHSINVFSPPAQEYWMGWYCNGARIGYSSEVTAPDSYRGQPVKRVVHRAVINLVVLGTAVRSDETDTVIVDQDYRPLHESYDVSSNGSATHIDAVYDYPTARIICRIGDGPSASTKVIHIPRGARLSADLTSVTEGQRLAPGSHVQLTFLNPLTVALEQAEVAVTGQRWMRDPATGTQVAVFDVSTTMPLGSMTDAETADGIVVKADMELAGFHFTLLHQPKAVAMGGGAAPRAAGATRYVPPPDFAVGSAVRTNEALPDPRAIRSLEVIVAGIPDKQFLLSDDRQAETVVDRKPGNLTARVDITATPYQGRDSARLPAPRSMKRYLATAPYLNLSAGEIKATAQRLAAAETSLYAIAIRIRDWVHSRMTPDASIGVPRSADDIFRNRRGVCRDYATLYTALARAAGVPTRICSGVVYAYGKFYYHAWAESYVGRWVAIDPTLEDPSDPAGYVDATHIKFAQGDPTSMFRVIGVIGKLQIRVVRFAPARSAT